ncbi:MAG: uncharacterized protein JWM37_320 [Candidatus Saccharibacteria bacterium]|nr:uncharacterized protein [Candidatus Saccharibacteria bacterium]
MTDSTKLTDMQRLYLLVGYPGAGKTTVSQLIKELTGAVHIWADHERKHQFINPRHDHAENLKLYQYLNDKTDQLLKQGKSVIYDTNFNFYKDRQALRAIADKYGVETIVIHLTTSAELARQRAVHEDRDRPTRVLGNMTADTFERIVNNLEPPRSDERTVEIDGHDVTLDLVRQALEP